MWEGPPCSQDEGTVQGKRRGPQGDFNTPVGSWAPPTPPRDPPLVALTQVSRVLGPWSVRAPVAKKQQISGSGTALSAVRPPGLGAPPQRSEDPRSFSSPLHLSCSPHRAGASYPGPSLNSPPTPHQTGPELRGWGSAAGLRLQRPREFPDLNSVPARPAFDFAPGDAGRAGKVRLAAREQQEAARRGLSAVRLAGAGSGGWWCNGSPSLFSLSKVQERNERGNSVAVASVLGPARLRSFHLGVQASLSRVPQEMQRRFLQTTGEPAPRGSRPALSRRASAGGDTRNALRMAVGIGMNAGSGPFFKKSSGFLDAD